MIKEQYVSFEVAKLLKEKGFKEETHGNYYLGGKFDGKFEESSKVNWNKFFKTPIAAPTQQMTMRWLREKHNIHIIAEPCLGEGFDNNLCFNRWFWTIFKEEGEYKPIRRIDEFETYEAAVEAAIKYCLEEILK